MPGPIKTYPTNQARQAAYRERSAERKELVAQLLDAVRNAQLPGDLHRVALDGEDNELLAALVAHYEALNWNRVS
jgi:hypothetical protein